MPYTSKDAKAHAIEVGGSCDWEYDQSLDIRSLVGGASVSSGWCHALVIMWIKKNFTSVDFLEWFGPAEKACPDRKGKGATVGPVFVELKKMMEEQSKLIAAFNGRPGRSWWAVDYALVRNVTQYGLTPGIDGMRGFEIGKNATFMVAMMEEIAGYSYIRLGDNNQTGHALGVYVGAPSVYVMFDPNFGQFRFPSQATFIAFLKKFMPKSGYGSDYARMALLHISAVT